MSRLLVNCSNSSSLTWSEEQRKEWDIIVDVPFPQVDPRWKTSEEKYALALVSARETLLEIIGVLDRHNNSCNYIMLQGDPSLCSILRSRLSLLDSSYLEGFIDPTTEMVVGEKSKEGSATLKSRVWHRIKKWVLDPLTQRTCQRSGRRGGL